MSTTLSRRAAVIDRYMQKVGVKTIADRFKIGHWAVRKWRQAGYVPNARLKGFCEVTGALPKEVCDPDLDFLFRDSNATKGS